MKNKTSFHKSGMSLFVAVGLIMTQISCQQGGAGGGPVTSPDGPPKLPSGNPPEGSTSPESEEKPKN